MLCAAFVGVAAKMPNVIYSAKACRSKWRAECLLLAHSGDAGRRRRRPVSGVVQPLARIHGFRAPVKVEHSAWHTTPKEKYRQ